MKVRRQTCLRSLCGGRACAILGMDVLARTSYVKGFLRDLAYRMEVPVPARHYANVRFDCENVNSHVLKTTTRNDKVK